MPNTTFYKSKPLYLVLICFLLFPLGSFCSGRYPPPPEVAQEPHEHVLHGETRLDPYVWLEDQENPQTRAFIEAQNAYAESVIGESPLRERLRRRLSELMRIDRIGSPMKGGEYEYFTMRRAQDEVDSIYRRPKRSEEEAALPMTPSQRDEVVIDETQLSSDSTVSISLRAVSKDGTRLIYHVRDGGRDEVELRVRDLESGQDLPHSHPNGLYGSLSLNKDETGFFYSLRSRETGARIYLYRFGSHPREDQAIFGEGYGPRSFVSFQMMDKKTKLLVTVQHGWASTDVFVLDLASNTRVTVAEGLEARSFPRVLDDELYLLTNHQAPNNRLVRVDLKRPQPENWTEVIPHAEHLLRDYARIEGKLYVVYLESVASKIRVFEQDGTPSGQIDLPDMISARISPAKGGKARLRLTGHILPSTSFDLDLKNGERTLWKASDVPFEATGFEVRQVWFESKDETRVPMYLVHRKDLEPTGDHPTLLYGYGGFNVALAPRFDASAAVWIENGGIYAVANLRGGSEFGENWHRSGMLENKQNVFDDFLAAAEWLIEQRYTNPEKLAIRGASNGGLLVASAMTQRPDLFRAVYCGLPDLDMLGFFTFTKTNNMPALLEYGDASREDHFQFLRRYSPYQAIRDGVRYPAVLLTSGDLDTRVPPLQARKMAARLQAASSSGYPVILRYDARAGHAGGRPLRVSIEEAAAELTFLMTQLGWKDSE